MSDPITSEIACITRTAMLDLARAAIRRRDIEVAGYWLERVERAECFTWNTSAPNTPAPKA